MADALDYIDSPAGLYAADGTEYRTTEALLRGYAEPVVEAVGLGVLLGRAGAWLRSPKTVSVLALPAFLAVLNPFVALALAVLLFAAWSVAAPGLVSRRLARVAVVAEGAAVQGLVTIVALSWFAMRGEMGAVWVGVLGFVAFRLGLVEAALRPVVAAARARLYPLPAPDQTLRALLVRHALARGVALEGMGEIERSVRSFWRREKR